MITQLDSFSHNIAAAQTVTQDVVTLANYIERVVNATHDLEKAWDQLERDYDNVLNAVNTVDHNKIQLIVIAKLVAAKTQWGKLAESADMVRRNHLSPPTSQ